MCVYYYDTTRGRRKSRLEPVYHRDTQGRKEKEGAQKKKKNKLDVAWIIKITGTKEIKKKRCQYLEKTTNKKETKRLDQSL